MDYNFNIEITTSQKLFEGRVITEFLREINANIRKKKTVIKKQVGPIIADAVQQSNEVQSILFGDLSAELGFVSPKTIARQIYKAVKRSVSIDFQTFKYDGKTISGGFLLYAIHDDFSDLIADIPQSSYLSNGHNIEWLRWLLFEGTNIIIKQYSITYHLKGLFNSRSGRAIMIDNPNGTWKVPAKWSGTQFDNFITRSLNKTVDDQIKNVLMRELS